MATRRWVRWLAPLAAAVLVLLGPVAARAAATAAAPAAPTDSRAGVVVPLSPAWGIAGSRADLRVAGLPDPAPRLLLGTDPAAAAPAPAPPAADRPATPAAARGTARTSRLGGRSPPA